MGFSFLLGSFIGGFFGVGGSFLFSEPAFVSLPDINCFLRVDQRLIITCFFSLRDITARAAGAHNVSFLMRETSADLASANLPLRIDESTHHRNRRCRLRTRRAHVS